MVMTVFRSLAAKRPTPRRVVSRLFPQYREAPLALNFSLLNFIRLWPPGFTLWFHWRRFRFSIGKHYWRQMEFDHEAGKAHLTDKVIPYNKAKIYTIGSLERTERLMNVLRTVEGVDTKSSKLLCIGPRNEAELLLLSLYGFPLKNVTAIDLFSYTPLIKVMDMHDLKFDDDQFDIVYSSYTLTYSDDVQRACSEALRVTRDSGFMAFGFGSNPNRKFGGTELTGGLDELYGYFGGHVRHVYWQQEVPDDAAGLSMCTSIFSITKGKEKSNRTKVAVRANG